jgi:hypothetical protein
LTVPRISLVLLLFFALVTVTARPAVAQPSETPAADPSPEDRREARRAFRAGMAAASQAEWETAAEHFREAIARVPAPAVRYNLAAALFELGQIVEAHGEITAARANPELPSSVEAAIEELETRVRAAGGMIVIELSGDVYPSGPNADIEVELDGTSIAIEALSDPVFVAPGVHVGRALRDGTEVSRAEAQVDAGATETLRLVIAPSASATAARAPPPASEEPEPESTSVLGQWWFWTAVGVVAVAAVVTVVLLASGGAQLAPIEGDFQPGVLTWP